MSGCQKWHIDSTWLIAVYSCYEQDSVQVQEPGTADVVDERLYREYRMRRATHYHQAVYREPEACLI